MVIAHPELAAGKTEIFVKRGAKGRGALEHTILAGNLNGRFQPSSRRFVVVSPRDLAQDSRFLEDILKVNPRSLKSGLVVPLPEAGIAHAMLFLGSHSDDLLRAGHRVSRAEIYAALAEHAETPVASSTARHLQTKDSAGFYRQFFDGIDLPAAILDEELTILQVNPAFEKTFGYTSQQLSHRRSIRDLIAKSERRALFPSRENRAWAQYEAMLVSRHGEEKSFEVTLQRLKSVATRIATFRDLSAIRESTTELREQTERLLLIHAVGEAVNAAVTVKEAFASALKQVRRVCQFEYAALACRRPSSSHIHLEVVFSGGRVSRGDGKMPARLFEQYVQKPSGLMKTSPPALLDFLGAQKFKSTLVLLLPGEKSKASTAASSRHSAKAAGCLLLAGRRADAFSAYHLQMLESLGDVLATGIRRVQLLQEARENYERLSLLNETKGYLENILKSSVDAIVTTDRRGCITYFSQGAENLFGLPAESAIGRAIADFLGDGSVESRRLLMQVMRGKKIQSHESEVVRGDGSRTPINLSISRLLANDGRVNGFLAIGKDISSRRAAEQESKRRGEELENYVYLISHNLKTPLSSIQGFVNLLQHDLGEALSRQHAHFLERIQKNAALMEKMIVDLLDFSRLARPSLNLALTSVEEIVQNVVDELKLQENMRDVEFDVTPDLPAVIADPEGLSIVFQNLIGNATKYRQPGVPLKIRIGWQSQPRFYAFWVKDNGIGMDPDFREKAFALFQRGANTGQIPGTGVGLALVKRIVENHHGLVYIESVPEAGTTVQFTIAKLSNQDN